MTESILKVENLTIRFGGLKAVSEVNLDIESGKIFGLIGPNGAGKTTIFNMLTGVYQPTSGDIRYLGNSVLGLKPFQITGRGIARTFQNIRLFKQLSVIENILISMDQAPETEKVNIFSSVLRTSRFLRVENEKINKCKELLKIFKLDNRADELASNLPYGDQRRLEIVRAIATGAKLLLLDEPAAGMNAQETKSLMETIRHIRDHFKLTIFLIEHDMKLVMGICERIAVIDYGVKIAEGSAQEIQKNPAVIAAYLGKANE